ncbi:rano class II histocompatibility antigen, A beta chain-like [Alligator mississippiensis]|uniref:rano class II histocompatibility antigen, A beta chain-like n=1 Tax=Alligator mississippiensis TaxID=8496 RepID=UPI002877C913|nr:rano class II histocompatibility antigen, A beta chain-like [Alligator mississippiensis]
MAPQANPILLASWLQAFCSVILAGVHHYSRSQLILSQEVPGLPKTQDMLKVNYLVFTYYDSTTKRLTTRNGYNPETQETQEWWRGGNTRCQVWNPWIETEFKALVQAVNASSPGTELYYMQVLHTCDLDEATGAITIVTRLALNGEDILHYRGDQKQWYHTHPAAQRLAEKWNQERQKLEGMNTPSPQRCRFLIQMTAPFSAQKTAKPNVHLSLIPASQGQPQYLTCHVTGFFPPDIDVTWERQGQTAEGEQQTSGVRPNEDHTLQIRVKIELGEMGVSPAEHVCVVRHSSLGETPLRVAWASSGEKVAGNTYIILAAAVSILLAFGAGSLWFYRRRKEYKDRQYRPPCDQPESADSSSAGQSSASLSITEAKE